MINYLSKEHLIRRIFNNISIKIYIYLYVYIDICVYIYLKRKFKYYQDGSKEGYGTLPWYQYTEDPRIL